MQELVAGTTNMNPNSIPLEQSLNDGYNRRLLCAGKQASRSAVESLRFSAIVEDRLRHLAENQLWDSEKDFVEIIDVELEDKDIHRSSEFWSERLELEELPDYFWALEVECAFLGTVSEYEDDSDDDKGVRGTPQELNAGINSGLKQTSKTWQQLWQELGFLVESFYGHRFSRNYAWRE